MIDLPLPVIAAVLIAGSAGARAPGTTTSSG